MARLHIAALLCCAAAALPLAPASAQPPSAAPAPAPEVPCTAPADPQEIVVCGRSDDARYRLPVPGGGFDPRGVVDSVSRERNRLLEVGAAGIHSCSTVGPGGWTGCDLRRWREAHQQRAGISQEQPHALTVGPVSVGVIKR
ncbi:MAG TPA: hypothetical protein VF552_11635 [Allosphingosinicella sp.]|jgi:hypothetical protein